MENTPHSSHDRTCTELIPLHSFCYNYTLSQNIRDNNRPRNLNYDRYLIDENPPHERLTNNDLFQQIEVLVVPSPARPLRHHLPKSVHVLESSYDEMQYNHVTLVHPTLETLKADNLTSRVDVATAK